jgi:hypothetical protein
MKDTLEQFAKLQRQLTQEREDLTKRLAAINAVLGGANAEILRGGEIVQAPANVTKAAAQRVERGTGKLTLAQAVLDAFGFEGGEKGNGKTIAELLPFVRATAGKTHKVTRPIVNLACLRLRDQGQLKHISRGVYALA